MAVMILFVTMSITVERYRGAPAAIHQTQAQAQEQAGWLIVWITENWPAFRTMLDVLGIVSSFAWAASVLKPLFQGRPDFGPGSPTWCDGEFAAASQNGFVRNLGSSFIVLQREKASLSSKWWLFTDKAQHFCNDLAARCGAATGNYVCAQYLRVMVYWNDSCTSWGALSSEAYLDEHYKQCW